MKKTPLVKLDLDLYEDVLDNGLRIYIVPVNTVNNIYVTFTTKFGSKDTSFIPRDSNKMIKVPDGIAHFLEHKVFEQKDGVDPFSFYSERGSEANANTDNFKTTYLFSGTSFFEENMAYLLDYVQEPYFTDENVEKEKGIIEQEMKMYQDNPYSVIYEKLIYNMIVKHPMKQPIIGNYKSIYSITKEDLYNCYNTFYHPSNMFVVVTGNVDPSNVIEVIKKNQKDKHFPKAKPIKIKEYKEPKEVAKEYEEKKMNVTLPKVGLGYKLNIDNINLPRKKIISYLSLFFDIKYDATSIINEELKKEGIINDELYLSSINFDNYIGIFILGESRQPDIFLKRVQEVLNDKDISEEDFERKKKSSIASLIGMTDNIFSINSKIVSNIIKYDKVVIDDYNEIKDLNVKELKEIISKLDFSNITTFVINPK